MKIIRERDHSSNKVERLREYLEDKIGIDIVLRIYDLIKSVARDDENWKYDDCFERLESDIPVEIAE